VQIRRVTKVVKGGKQLSFRAVVVVGNEKGTVGVGVAAAKEVIMAVQVSRESGRARGEEGRRGREGPGTAARREHSGGSRRRTPRRRKGRAGRRG